MMAGQSPPFGSNNNWCWFCLILVCAGIWRKMWVCRYLQSVFVWHTNSMWHTGWRDLDCWCQKSQVRVLRLAGFVSFSSFLLWYFCVYVVLFHSQYCTFQGSLFFLSCMQNYCRMSGCYWWHSVADVKKFHPVLVSTEITIYCVLWGMHWFCFMGHLLWDIAAISASTLRNLSLCCEVLHQFCLYIEVM